MAKFNGIPPFTGTYKGVCIYLMHGQYYLRTASSLTGKRVKKDRAFRKTMQYAALLATASTIGSAVYAAIPAHQRQHALYRKLTGEAMTWLRYQWTEEDIIAYLLRQCSGQAMPILAERRVTKLSPSFAHKTPRLRPHTKKLKRKLRRSLKDAARMTKPSYSLSAYRAHERHFRREYNKEIMEYPWAASLRQAA